MLAGCSDGGRDDLRPSPAATLLPALVGLWSGPGRQTPLGDFAVMNMDLRPADPYTLFARADLDAGNSLRFAFAIERGEAGDVLVFRNGGYFQGVLRDTRAALVDAGPDRFRFCASDRGCGYLEATWTLTDATHLILDVRVRGVQHLLWSARRMEERSAPSPFPADSAAHREDRAPFPPLPALAVAVDWSSSLTKEADVWVLLSRDGCGLTGCAVSRSFMTTAAAGATGAALRLEQVHAGDYQVMAILDRDQSFRATLTANAGDGVTWPLNQHLTVSATGETALGLHIALDVP